MTAPFVPAEVRPLRALGLGDGDDVAPLVDHVAVERPLTVRVRGRDGEQSILATTMSTPGDDLALAIGLCLSEGVLPRPAALMDAQRCPDVTEGDVVLVTIDTPRIELGNAARVTVMSSSCGICGRTAVQDVADRSRVQRGGAAVVESVLRALPARLRDQQDVFGKTGGLHAVALFDLEGALLDLCEDVGRHNAFDKIVGRAVRRGSVPLDNTIVMLSGRASYELLAKAAVVGAPVVAAIGAPSSLAVDIAQRCGITLVGFLREDRGNVYTHSGRILAGTDPHAAKRQLSAPS